MMSHSLSEPYRAPVPTPVPAPDPEPVTPDSPEQPQEPLPTYEDEPPVKPMAERVGRGLSSIARATAWA
jgi:hypothetical protein